MKPDQYPETNNDDETQFDEFGLLNEHEHEEFEENPSERMLSKTKEASQYTREEWIEAFQQTVKFMMAIPGMDKSRLQHQLQVAKKVIDEFVDGRESVVAEMPTGFGKSFFAFIITKIFEFLDEKNSSYILVPNKFLQDQYDKDIKQFNLYTYKMIKGQSNYTCPINNDSPFAERTCKDSSISSVMNGMSTQFAKCTKTCKYMCDRREAITAKTTVQNYNYWLSTINYVWPMLADQAPFKPRTVTIFDETHVLGDIVQDMFAVELNLNTVLRRTTAYYPLLQQQFYVPREIPTPEALLSELINQISSIEADLDNVEKVYDHLTKIVEVLVDIHKPFNKNLEDLIDGLPKNEDDKPQLEDIHRQLLGYDDLLDTYIESITNILALYKQLGKETIVASVDEIVSDRIVPYKNFGKISTSKLVLQCTKEAELCKLAVHSKSDYKIFMSATIGNLDHYAEQTGIENYGKVVVPQVFNYDKSPIYKVTPMLSMAHRNKVANTPAMVQRILRIIDNHPNERGLIHTGNYALARKLAETGHPRIMMYNNSNEKLDMIRELENRPDAVIIGPSITTGVDLKNDLCRFMIFMKVPYKSLADRLTKAKMNLYSRWYGWVTLASVLQGLGRGIRNYDDYCVTYLMDEAFNNFFYRNPAPKWVQDRFKTMLASNIGEEFVEDDLGDFL